MTYEITADKLGRSCAKDIRYAADDVNEEQQQMGSDYHREEHPLARALRCAGRFTVTAILLTCVLAPDF